MTVQEVFHLSVLILIPYTMLINLGDLFNAPFLFLPTIASPIYFLPTVAHTSLG